MTTESHLTKAWISPEFLTWDSYVEWYDQPYESRSDASKAYNYWRHAEAILANHGDETQYRSDAVGNLKKAVYYRVRQLTRQYSLDKLSLGAKKEKLQRLGALGIVRPAMLLELVSLRDTIEHDYADPGPLQRCHELLDMVWYFLRSTDEMAVRVPDSLIYDAHVESPLSKYGLSEYRVALSARSEADWHFKIEGWISASYLSETRSDWIGIQVIKLLLRDEVVQSDMPFSELDSQRAEGSLLLQAITNPLPHIDMRLVRSYFNVAQMGMLAQSNDN